MNLLRNISRLCGFVLLAACAEEPPPISSAEFMERPRLLEATMIRCAQNRSESRYVAECINARDAVNRLEAAEERTRREGLEAQSERKRQAPRRTQEAAAKARRRAEENQLRREEEEYQGIFGEVPDSTVDPVAGDQPSPASSNAPTVIVPPAAADPADNVEEVSEEPQSDLSAIREELKRRQETPE